MSTVAKAFVQAKRKFSPALKDKTNPAFRSKYADLGACLESVNDALLECGIALYQETSEDETGITVETVLLHESGESIRSGKLHVPAVKQDPQGFGSAMTYARRYSLMAACGIAPEDDDGNAGREAAERAAKTAAEKWAKQVADHLAEINAAATVEECDKVGTKALKAAEDAKDREAYRSIRAAYKQRSESIKSGE